MPLMFLDFEASSLLPGSYPIEVAWVAEDGTGESHLIRPTEEWLDAAHGNPAWREESAGIHGIALATLMIEGEPAAKIARLAEAALSPLPVLACSDAPTHDARWLRRLYEAGGIQRDVVLFDVREVYAISCRALLDLLPPLEDPNRRRAEQRIRALAAEIIARAEEVEQVRQRTHHRALPDAQALWRTHAAIRHELSRRLREDRPDGEPAAGG